MDFKQLRAFIAVAETGNVTRAADVLHVVQSAVSRLIRLLEQDMGVALFERERHGMVLTPAGQALLDYARRAMLELARARAEVGATGQAVGGLVTLGLLPSTSEVLASALVAAVAQEFPGIRLRIVMGYAGTLLRWLDSGEADAALLYGAERTADIQAVPLIEEPLWVIGPRGSGLRADRAVPLAELAAHRLVLPSAPHGIRTIVDHACAVAHVELDILAETNALSVQRSLVLGGHGLTILPPISVAEDLRRRRLAGAPLADPAVTRTIVLATSSSRPAGRAARCAIDILVREAKRAVAAGTWREGRWLGG